MTGGFGVAIFGWNVGETKANREFFFQTCAREIPGISWTVWIARLLCQIHAGWSHFAMIHHGCIESSQPYQPSISLKAAPSRFFLANNRCGTINIHHDSENTSPPKGKTPPFPAQGSIRSMWTNCGLPKAPFAVLHPHIPLLPTSQHGRWGEAGFLGFAAALLGDKMRTTVTA